MEILVSSSKIYRKEYELTHRQISPTPPSLKHAALSLTVDYRVYNMSSLQFMSLLRCLRCTTRTQIRRVAFWRVFTTGLIGILWTHTQVDRYMCIHVCVYAYVLRPFTWWWNVERLQVERFKGNNQLDRFELGSSDGPISQANINANVFY